MRLDDASPVPFWLDRPAPADAPPLDAAIDADLAIVGAGFTGLWAALQAKLERPDREVVVLEAETAGAGASGRNGGFADASLTHGLLNGASRFPAELEALDALGRDNVAGMRADLARHGIDAAWQEPGMLSVATQPHELAELDAEAALLRRYGWEADVLDRDAVRSLVRSPTYLGAVLQRTGIALVDPGALALGLRRAVLELGVWLFERTPVTEAAPAELTTPAGRVRAPRILLASGAYRPLVRSIRRLVAPVYDYVIVTEPLTAAQRRELGWEQGQGIADRGNQFHYYRLTPDGRVLFGGYDAVYHFGNRVDDRRLNRRPETFRLLADHLLETFPALEGVAVTHAWGGPIDTCSRFCVTFGRALGGTAVYAVGYTGLGVAATRFGARTALDLLDGAETERTRLRLVRTRPLPFPPEPARWAVIQATRAALARADAHGGRRGPWLRALDRLGLGFDS
ncbi:MAG TPA: FAD-dependent oxidoreductase [Solirubrobacteraceae bacterium]|nr:FAD-dependent oxidoreductase [Solirubrobacteraceae bacterium]